MHHEQTDQHEDDHAHGPVGDEGDEDVERPKDDVEE